MGPSTARVSEKPERAKASKPLSICVIGNSHLLALKNAWTDSRRETNATLTFFAASTNLLDGLELQGRSLVAPDSTLRDKLERSSDGKNRIDIDDFDAFAIVGAGFGVDVPYLCETISIAEQHHLNPAMPVISHGVFRACAREVLRRCSAHHVAKLLRKVFTGPLIMYATPFRAQKLIDMPELKNDARMRDPSSLEIVVRLALDAAAQLSAGKDALFLRQDDDTIGLPGFTREAFWRTPSERDIRRGTLDTRHMNETYALRTLNAILSNLDNAPQTSMPASRNKVGEAA